MAKRPVFIPDPQGPPFVKEVVVEFVWYPGFAKSRAQKSIESLHKAAAEKLKISPILEVSLKSADPLGVSLSAFHLILKAKGRSMPVECAFQGSKVFERGGPYTDLYSKSGREAKKDGRLQNSGKLVAFDFMGEKFPTDPKTLFYDWLYITALWQNAEFAEKILAFRAFSDIAFNPKRSINCQARAAALFVSLRQSGRLERAIREKDYYIRLVIGEQSRHARVKEAWQQLALLSSNEEGQSEDEASNHDLGQ